MTPPLYILSSNEFPGLHPEDPDVSIVGLDLDDTTECDTPNNLSKQRAFLLSLHWFLHYPWFA